MASFHGRTVVQKLLTAEDAEHAEP
jgi:hypothetical protein